MIRLVTTESKSISKTHLNEFTLHGWRRGSVARTLVFDWRTSPDLCAIQGWQVTILWVNCPLWVS